MSRAVIPGEEWKGAGEAEGLQIWRIEDKVPVPVPEAEHGTFYRGDSYIVLSTVMGGRGKKQDIHFWLGSESSVDERGIAAYKTVELDEYLGGSPVQHREVEGNESSLFLSYFKARGGVQYLEGGVDSAFNHVEPDKYEPRLLHLKGRRNVRATQVALSVSSMNQGDVFVLDKGLVLFLWNGAEANRFEKAKGVELVVKLRNERGARPQVVFMDEDPENADFWELLGGRGEVPPAEAGGDDEATDMASDLRLFRISDDSGTLEMSEIDKREGRFTRDMLDEDDVFLLDSGPVVFVWIGRGATKQERQGGMKMGEDYLREAGKPSNTRISRVVQNGEPAEFKSLFFQWDPPVPPPDFSAHRSEGIARREEQKEIDVGAMVEGGLGRREDEQLLGGSEGVVEAWRVEDMRLAEWPAELHGQFYGGDSYVVRYRFRDARGREQCVIYFWLGNKSSTDEKATAALETKNMDDAMGGIATQVRVTQGKEPSHFRALFKGRMVVHAGGRASGFKNRDDEDTYDTDGVSLFHVRGTSELNTMAAQVEEKATSLNSGDCFVLLTPGVMFVWNGSGANEEERKVAMNVAEMLKESREVAVVNEGEEPDAFWDALGGKAEYPSSKELQEAPKEPRLFLCSNASGTFQVEEVFNFSQSDLQDDDVMLLDTHTQAFVWVGTGANETEKRMAQEVAEKYVAAAADRDGRDPDIPIVRVDAGREPPIFTCHFLGWDAEGAQRFEDPYERRKRELAAAREAVSAEEEKKHEETTVTAEHVAAQQEARKASMAGTASGTFPYDVLKTSIPEGVDPRRKEDYLSDKEFQTVFKMSKGEFAGLKDWKRTALKKAVGLF
eukprot:CAMPEP_0196782858 /NCGR_PEP_ID=MMETSP1104-20130614/12172_1 /TAXON_ID=33652 /ORGANISM="Cafeteria sp., Strain Caron Lab Isolate" /LENGTH=839 /DNA_ID=CAMNT_0042153103 /DNA_START=26 /DNA_END=2545 /DNA_ORIENTATION=+